MALSCPWDKGMDEVVQSCSTCLDVNFDDLESQLGILREFLLKIKLIKFSLKFYEMKKIIMKSSNTCF